MSGRRAVAVFHSGRATGPVRTLGPRLAALRPLFDELTVLVPAAPARETFPYAEVLEGGFEPVAAPRSPALLPGEALRRLREVHYFTGVFRRLRPELVVLGTTYVPTALLAAALRRIPVLVYAAELPGAGRRQAPSPADRALVAVTGRLATTVVAPSDLVASRFPSRKTTRIYPGIAASGPGDAGRFRPPSSRLCLAVVGSLTEGRGQDVAIRALARIRRAEPSATLLVAGEANWAPVDAAFRQRLDELVAELALERAVRFLGAVDEVADVYAAADIVVAPTRVKEAFGRVPQEALVAGRPVVVSRVGAIPETLVHERTALLVEPGDPEALADAVLRLASDGALAARIVETGRRQALDRFDEAAGVSRFSDVAGAILQGRP